MMDLSRVIERLEVRELGLRHVNAVDGGDARVEDRCLSGLRDRGYRRGERSRLRLLNS